MVTIHILTVNGMSNKIKIQEGFIALITVLIISAVVLLVAVSASLLGISESDMGLKQSLSSRAFYLANLCAEDALVKLKQDLGYSGNETLDIDGDSCTILPIEGNGNIDRTVKTKGEVLGQVRKIKVEIDRVNPQMQIRSWLETTEF